VMHFEIQKCPLAQNTSFYEDQTTYIVQIQHNTISYLVVSVI